MLFDQVVPPRILTEHREAMDKPIILAELIDAIEALKPSKSPGPDGLSAKSYKFKEILSLHLLNLFRACLVDHDLPSQKEPRVVLLPKRGKDLGLPQTYCPISLLNVDYKLLAGILASRLNSFLPQYIHKDHVGFIPKRQLRDNTRRIINIINLAQETKIPTLLHFLDAEKAFDMVNWQFLNKVLVGVWPQFLPLEHSNIFSAICRDFSGGISL